MENNITNASEFSIGSVLSSTYATLLRNPGVFFGICFIALIPMIATDIIQHLYPSNTRRIHGRLWYYQHAGSRRC